MLDERHDLRRANVGQSRDRSLGPETHAGGEVTLIADQDCQFAMARQQRFGEGLVASGILDAHHKVGVGGFQPADQVDSE